MTLRKGHVICHVITQALSYHVTMHMILGYKHVTDHVIRQALSCHVIMHVILGKNHLASQGIGQQYSHVPFQGLDTRCVC